jgi:hypothetical protein
VSGGSGPAAGERAAIFMLRRAATVPGAESAKLNNILMNQWDGFGGMDSAFLHANQQ